MSLRVLLAMHHRLYPGSGAPAATLALGSALSDQGCKVDYFGYEQAFGHDSVDSMGSSLHYPWRLASYLKRRVGDFDVADISAGDAWVWARRRSRGKTPVIISRSQGLEHPLDQWRRAQAAQGKLALSWKYPFYHGGYRLFEVRKSLQGSDQSVFLNDSDRDYAVDKFGLSPLQVSVMGHGIGRQFIGLWEPAPAPVGVPLKLAAVDSWTELKGKATLIDAAARLFFSGVPFTLTLLGTVLDEVQVRSEFPVEVRPHIRIVPQYRPNDLPDLLLAQQVLLMCSAGEAFAMSLPEAMACGLAPIATRVGGAGRIIIPGSNGELMQPGDAKAIAAIVTRWSNDRTALQSIRLRAQQTAQRLDWNQVAAQTIGIYERVLKRVTGIDLPRVQPGELLTPANSIWQRNGKPALSICICTSNRPQVLRRCLASIEQGEVLPAEVVVGDDSLDGTETAAVCRDFSFVRYVRGPRRGLCANRNVVVAAALGDYIALLDDDSEVTPQFVKLAQEVSAHADGRTIFTGDVLEHGVDRVPPSNPTFWGHFGKPLSEVGACETVQLNCNVFPKSAFRDARFDEHIVFGYEDMDLCQQMLASGYRIEYRRELLNLHLPPPRSQAIEYFPGLHVERARYYTSLKRYMLWQSRPFRAFLYAALAPMHQAAHYLLRRKVGQALAGFGDMSWALSQAMAFRKSFRQSDSAAVER